MEKYNQRTTKFFGTTSTGTDFSCMPSFSTCMSTSINPKYGIACPPAPSTLILVGWMVRVLRIGCALTNSDEIVVTCDPVSSSAEHSQPQTFIGVLLTGPISLFVFFGSSSIFSSGINGLDVSDSPTECPSSVGLTCLNYGSGVEVVGAFGSWCVQGMLGKCAPVVHRRSNVVGHVFGEGHFAGPLGCSPHSLAGCQAGSAHPLGGGWFPAAAVGWAAFGPAASEVIQEGPWFCPSAPS